MLADALDALDARFGSSTFIEWQELRKKDEQK